MIKYLFALILSCSALTAQPWDQSAYCPTTDPCGVDNMSSPTSIMIRWKNTEWADRVYVELGMPGFTTADFRHEHVHPGSTDIERRILMNGLTPGTTYEFRVGVALVSDPTHTLIWSNRGTYTTPTFENPSARWDLPPEPELPPTARVARTGNLYTVGPDCTSATDGLQALLTQAANADDNLNHEIVIPHTTVCTGFFTIGNHIGAGGWITVKSDTVGTTTFPPQGVRIDPTKYESQMATIQYPLFKTGGVTHLDGDNSLPSQTSEVAFRITDKSDKIRVIGIKFQAEPTDELWVHRDGTCSGGNGAGPVSVTLTTTDHFMATGRRMRVLSTGATGYTGLTGNEYTITSTGGKTLTLDGTNAVTGTSGQACRIAVLASMKLTSCTAGTGGVIRCDTSRAHGLVNNTVTKVTGDLSYGFSPQTGYVTVVDADTVEFTGTTAAGSYTPNSASLVVDGGNVGYMFSVSTPSTDTASNNIIIEQSYFKNLGYPYRNCAMINQQSDYSALLHNWIDDNYQWTAFTLPGTTTLSKVLGFQTGSTNVRVDKARVWLGRGNYIAYHIIGRAGSDNNGGGRATIPHDFTDIRNVYEFRKQHITNLSNTDWDGVTAERNRQGHEHKAINGILMRGNLWFGTVEGQDVGNITVLTNKFYDLSTQATISNIRIEYNLVGSGATGPTFTGSNVNNSYWDNMIAKRIFFRHNVVNVDGISPGKTDVDKGRGYGWSFRGLQDAVFENNLVIGRGVEQSFFGTNGGPLSGIKMRNNVFFFNKGVQPMFWMYSNTSGTTGHDEWEFPSGVFSYPTGSNTTLFWHSWTNSMLSYGQTTPVLGYAHLDPNAEFKNNVLALGIESASTGSPTCDASNTAGCNASKAECEAAMTVVVNDGLGDPRYAGNYCEDFGGGADADTYNERTNVKLGLAKFDRVPMYTFADYRAGAFDFLLKADSPVKGKGSANTAAGPDMQELYAQLGRVKGPWKVAYSATSATVGYLAPDSDACSVDYWQTGVSWDTAAPLRISDGGGARARSVTLPSLTAETEYSLYVQCEVEQPAMSFWTKAE